MVFSLRSLATRNQRSGGRAASHGRPVRIPPRHNPLARCLRFESLEDRRLLTGTGPTVSNIVVASAAATPVLTWNVADTAGLGSSTITIDGGNRGVYGPYGSSTSGDYAGLLGNLSAGTHSYVITATDASGVVSTTEGTFTLAGPIGNGPVISNLVTATTAATPVLTWNVSDASGIGSTTLTLDGNNLDVEGPYGSNTNSNYAGLLGTLSAGAHTYVITATDVNGVASTAQGTFTLAGPMGSGPEISNVVVDTAAATPVITWNVADTVGIQSATLTLDGASLPLYGPYGDSRNANYAGSLGAVPAGSHTYVITTTDANGVATTFSSTFLVDGVNASISNIVFDSSAATPVMTWNVADAAGIQSVTLNVNNSYMTVYGPYGSSTNANYGAQLTGLSAGWNTYIVTVTGDDGVTTTYNGINPEISNIVVDLAAATPVITWGVNTYGAGMGIMSTAITVDGTYLSVDGPPFGSSTTYGNYAGVLNSLSPGNHTFVITAAGSSTTTTYTSTFTVRGISPTISSVVVAPTAATPVITWNAADSAGIQSAAMTVDGNPTPLYGPYGSSTNANFAAGLGNLATGNHTYAITVTSAGGVSSTYGGTFVVSGISPLISDIVPAPAAATPVITWNVADPTGIRLTTVAVDGTKLVVYGPYGSNANADYAGTLGGLTAGAHSYVIIAVGANGVLSSASGTFSVASPAAVAAALSAHTGSTVQSDWLLDADSIGQNLGNNGTARDAAFALT